MSNVRTCCQHNMVAMFCKSSKYMEIVFKSGTDIVSTAQLKDGGHDALLHPSASLLMTDSSFCFV